MFYLQAFLLATLIMTTYGYGKKIEVQGHRGCRGTRPENTLPAFAAAIEAGVDALEPDLLLTQDDVFVIYHSHFIKPSLVTYLDGSPLAAPPLMRSLNLSQVKQFDCGRIKNPLYPQQSLIPETTIPTLEELFSLIQTSPHPHAAHVQLNLEIKRDVDSPISPERCAQKLLKLVEANGFSQRVYYSSFDPEVLFEVRKSDPTASIGFLKEDDLDGMIECATALKAEIISPDDTLIKDPHYIRSLQQLGFKVILWTVNDPARWEELIQMGVDGIITDYPHELIAFLREKNFRD